MAFGGGNAEKAGDSKGTVCGQCISNFTFLPTFDKLPHKFQPFLNHIRSRVIYAESKTEHLSLQISNVTVVETNPPPPTCTCPSPETVGNLRCRAATTTKAIIRERLLIINVLQS